MYGNECITQLCQNWFAVFGERYDSRGFTISTAARVEGAFRVKLLMLIVYFVVDKGFQGVRVENQMFPVYARAHTLGLTNIFTSEYITAELSNECRLYAQVNKVIPLCHFHSNESHLLVQRCLIQTKDGICLCVFTSIFSFLFVIV